MKISSSLVTSMTEINDMVNTTIEADKIVPLARVLTMLTQIPSNNTMLEMCIPPDKCTVLNIAITYYGEEYHYTLPGKEPSHKFKVPKITSYVIHPNQNIYGSHKVNTRADVYVPLNI